MEDPQSFPPYTKSKNQVIGGQHRERVGSAMKILAKKQEIREFNLSCRLSLIQHFNILLTIFLSF